MFESWFSFFFFGLFGATLELELLAYTTAQQR